MKLGELALALDAELRGDADASVQQLASLSGAGADELAFAVSKRYLSALQASGAGAIITTDALAVHAPCSVLVTPHPYAAYAQASWLLQADERWAPGIHPTAVVDPAATLGAAVSVGAGVVIEADVVLGDGVVIGAQGFIGRGSVVGAGSRLFPRVVVYHRCHVGERCRIQSGAIIGAEGFGYAPGPGGWIPIHQTGGVHIGCDVHIGANTTIDRGAIDDTRIHNGVILDNQIQIAHNVEIGENTAIAGCVGIAGSTRIGRRCQIGGACNIVGHIEVADGVIINAASLVARSIETSGHYGSGMPLQPVAQWRRTYAALDRLDKLLRRVGRLERNR